MKFDYNNYEHVCIVIELIEDNGYEFTELIDGYDMGDECIMLKTLLYEVKQSVVIDKKDFIEKFRERKIEDILDV